MTADALLTEIQNRADFIFAGWNVLMVSGLGLLIFVAWLRDRRLTGWLMAGYGFFAVTHLLGMLHVSKQWASLNDALKYKLQNEPEFLEKLDFAILAPDIAWIVPFHLAFDGLILVAMFRLRR